MTTLRPPAVATLVTGGAGFIGGEVVRALLGDGCAVTILDDLSTAAPGWEARLAARGTWRLVVGDVADPAAVASAMDGCSRVVHLAAGTDIEGGFGHPERDFRAGVVGTETVCEAMLRGGVPELWYASSGVVYGDVPGGPTGEGDGPYRPASHYAAGKLAGEAIVSGFAHLYGWRAVAFRFGNTQGPDSDHGVVHDLVVKLLRDPTRLEILGDGSQRKPYVDVTDLVAGMRHAAARAAGPMTVLNVGPEGTLSVDEVVDLVIGTLGLDPARVERTYRVAGPRGGGWRGDTPFVEFDTRAMAALGWRPAVDAADAVRRAAAGIAARYRDGALPLRTTAERRRGGLPRQAATGA
jgi:UDP-glucose 4-epimerase